MSHSRLASQIAFLGLPDAEPTRALVLALPGNASVADLADALSAASRFGPCLWVARTRLEAEQVMLRFGTGDAGEVALVGSSVQVKSLRNEVAHARRPFPRILVGTVAQLVKGDLRTALPAGGYWAVVIEVPTVGTERESVRWLSRLDDLQSRHVLLFAGLPTAATTTWLQKADANLTLDARPTSDELTRLLSVRTLVLEFDQSPEERALLAELPAGYVRPDRGRFALRGRLERDVSWDRAMMSVDASDEDSSRTQLIDRERAVELLERVDDLPLDPRLVAVADLANREQGTSILCLSTLRDAVPYYVQGLRQLLGDDQVGTAQGELLERLTVSTLADLRGVEGDWTMIVWLDQPASLDGVTRRIVESRSRTPSTIVLLSPTDASAAERHVLERTLRGIADLPDRLARVDP